MGAAPAAPQVRTEPTQLERNLSVALDGAPLRHCIQENLPVWPRELHALTFEYCVDERLDRRVDVVIFHEKSFDGQIRVEWRTGTVTARQGDVWSVLTSSHDERYPRGGPHIPCELEVSADALAPYCSETWHAMRLGCRYVLCFVWSKKK